MFCIRPFARIIAGWALMGALAACAAAQECSQAGEIEQSTRAAIDSAAVRFIQLASRGDVQSLRQESIPSLASSFDEIQQTVTSEKGEIGDQVSIRRDYLLDASKAPSRIASAEFFCGVYGAGGHTPSSASFVIPNLDPGLYALVLTNVAGGKTPHMATVILQKLQNQWKLAGYYPKPTEVNGHDAAWYVQQARNFKNNGRPYDAWFYYMVGWNIYAPVEFMSSLQLDKLSNEIQSARPADIPGNQPVQMIAANGHSYEVTQLFATADQMEGLSLVARYRVADLSDTARAFQDNVALIKALVAKYPELREAFTGIVARATAANGQDYGTLLAMKDIH